MRLLTTLFLSLLSITSVCADGFGQYKNKQAKQQATIDRQNTITVQANSGITLVSRSLQYNPATNESAATTAYDEVDIVAGISYPWWDFTGQKGKVEILIDNLNITQTGAGRRANFQVSEFAFAWRPFSIVQYVETATQQNGFDVNDTLCHEYVLRPSKANAFTFKWLNSTVVPADNGTTTLHTFQGASQDGVFKLILKATGSTGTNTITSGNARAKSVWIDGRFVSPTSIKFDTIIDVTQAGFKLNTTAACTNYQVALKSWARSMQDVFARTTTKQTVNGTTTSKTKVTFLDRIQTGGDATPFGFFTWATTAAVTTNDGTNAQGTTNVLATTLVTVKNDEDKDDLRVTKQAVHSFDAIRPGVIRWDPEFGSDVTNPDAPTNPAPNGASASITSISMIAIVVAIMSLFAQ